MKFVVTLLLFVAVPAALATFDNRIDEYLYKLEKECSEESGLDSQKVDKIREDLVLPVEKAASKWAKCMMQKHSVLNSDGSMNTDAYSITIPDDSSTVVLEAFPICSKLTGGDIEERGRLLWNCYRDNSDALLMATGD